MANTLFSRILSNSMRRRVLLLIGWLFVLTPAGGRIFLEVISIKNMLKMSQGSLNGEER